MKKWYVYVGSKLVDIVQAFSAEGAIRQASTRTIYLEHELTASSVFK